VASFNFADMKAFRPSPTTTTMEEGAAKVDKVRENDFATEDQFWSVFSNTLVSSKLNQLLELMRLILVSCSRVESNCVDFVLYRLQTIFCPSCLSRT